MFRLAVETGNIDNKGLRHCRHLKLEPRFTVTEAIIFFLHLQIFNFFSSQVLCSASCSLFLLFAACSPAVTSLLVLAYSSSTLKCIVGDGGRGTGLRQVLQITNLTPSQMKCFIIWNAPSSNPIQLISSIVPTRHALFNGHFIIQGVFLTGPPLKMSLDWPPQKMSRLAPPTLKKYGD